MTPSALLVDDDPVFLSLARRILEGMGVEVVATAESSAAAIEAAHATKPEAALVDIGLPDGDGADLGSQLAALPWRPRVVLTSSDRDILSTLDAGDRRRSLPFLPKEELADGALRRLLLDG
jgi:DNA-binding NarL/FixJ family response regulator